MIVFRLNKSIYSKDLSGRGAERYGGRWNSKGTSIVYTCDSRALCTAEIAVHSPLGIVPKDYELIILNIPDKIRILEIKENELPRDWKSFPHSHSTQIIGDNFVKQNKILVAKVPSSIVQGDYNYLLNPSHKDFPLVQIVRIEKFEFDSRLFIR